MPLSAKEEQRRNKISFVFAFLPCSARSNAMWDSAHQSLCYKEEKSEYYLLHSFRDTDRRLQKAWPSQPPAWAVHISRLRKAMSWPGCFSITGKARVLLEQHWKSLPGPQLLCSHGPASRQEPSTAAESMTSLKSNVSHPAYLS